MAAVAAIFYMLETEPETCRLVFVIKTPIAARCDRGWNICTGWELHMLVYSVLNVVGLADSLLDELTDYVGVTIEVE